MLFRCPICTLFFSFCQENYTNTEHRLLAENKSDPKKKENKYVKGDDSLWTIRIIYRVWEECHESVSEQTYLDEESVTCVCAKLIR